MREAAASDEPERIGQFEAVAGRYAEHGAAEQDPCVELIRRQAEGDVVDDQQTWVRSLMPGWRFGGKLEIDLEQAVGAEVAVHEVDDAAVRRLIAGTCASCGPIAAVEADAFERRRTVERARRIVGEQADRAHRRAVFVKMPARKRVADPRSGSG